MPDTVSLYISMKYYLNFNSVISMANALNKNVFFFIERAFKTCQAIEISVVTFFAQLRREMVIRWNLCLSKQLEKIILAKETNKCS